MAQQPYMGLGLLLPPLFEVTKSCAFVAVGDWSTGRATVLSILMCPPEPSGGNLAYATFLFIFTCRKSTTWDRRLYFPSEGSGAPDFYHP
jgi:hypothetical protein